MKIVKELINLKILTESSLMTADLKRLVKTHKDKVIPLDSEEEQPMKKAEMKT